jgi:hypothetical protein
MLSDACFDFIYGYVREKDAARAVAELLEEVEWYTRPDFPIRSPATHVYALRQAIKRVRARPNDKDEMLWLVMLAECVRAHLDMDPDDGMLDRWCARWVREREHTANGRCPECGHEVKRGYKMNIEPAVE